MDEKQELIQSLYEYLPKLHDGIEKNIDYYRTNQIAMADELIISVLDGLSWSIDAIVLIAQLESISIDIIRIKDILNDMLMAIENDDKVLITDILEYEVLEKLEEWFEIVKNYYE